MAMPLWLFWSRLAASHAAQAMEARPSDAYLDAVSMALQTPGSTIDDFLPTQEQPAPVGTAELDASLVAVVASALAIDGLYGASKSLIRPPPSTASRPRRILETLKLGFSVGRDSTRWLPELDWLFRVRDLAVHHQECLRPAVITRVTSQTVVVSATEVEMFSAPNACRAASLCAEIISTCLGNPKRATREWAEDRRRGLVASSSPDADPT